MLPSLREAVTSNRYTAAEKHAAAVYCVRRLSERIAVAQTNGEYRVVNALCRVRDWARRIEAEWRENR